MIRLSEMILAGHPDKFCDLIAASIVDACEAFEPDAYAQIEVATWCDEVWLNGGIATNGALPFTLEEIVHDITRRVGYTNEDGTPRIYRVHDAVCKDRLDPRQWTEKVNDQSIVIGWAGYDEKTSWLPPEHYLAHRFRIALEESIRGYAMWGVALPGVPNEGGRGEVPQSVPSPLRGEGKGEGRHWRTMPLRGGQLAAGSLASQGPDGKLLLRIRENENAWHLEHLLITLQQRPETNFLDFAAAIEEVLSTEYEKVRETDKRWANAWDNTHLLINPNGPLINGGSDGDNGQTGRKLVVDYYGPRVPIGGGALSGKHRTHIDRLGATRAREAAIHAVQTGARECKVTVAYAPNEPHPLEVIYEMEGRGERRPPEFFAHLVPTSQTSTKAAV